jgi:chemotaxis signal transduction protein
VSGRGGSPLLAFRIGTTRAALPLGLVREVIESPRIVRVPGSHPHVAGVALNRGVALPVYDLRRFTPLWCGPEGTRAGSDHEGGSHLIVCGFEEILLGVLAEQVDLVEAAGAAENLEAGEVRAEYLNGLLMSGGEAVALLDPARLFPSLGVPAERSGGPPGEDAGEEDPAGR